MRGDSAGQQDKLARDPAKFIQVLKTGSETFVRKKQVDFVDDNSPHRAGAVNCGKSFVPF